MVDDCQSANSKSKLKSDLAKISSGGLVQTSHFCFPPSVACRQVASEVLVWLASNLPLPLPLPLLLLSLLHRLRPESPVDAPTSLDFDSAGSC